MKPLLPICVLVMFVAVGAGPCVDQPFGVSLTGYDEQSGQQQAVIMLSDPQIFSRETLVDDRRSESEFLRELLSESKTVKFEPELRRQTRLVSSLAGGLGIKFDPAAGLSAAQAAEVGGLRQQIELTRLRAELAAAQKDEAAAESKPEATAGSTTPSTVTAPGLDDVRKVTADLEKVVERLENAADKAIPETRGSSTPASPREHFRDLQTYRGELRAALESVILDDVHDDWGNSLYRLEFRATVLPGAHKGQLGVARITIHPPKLDEGDVDDLYKTWLAHVTFRLNPRFTTPYVPPNFGRLRAFDRAGLLFRLHFLPFAFEKRDDVACRSFSGIEKSDRCGGVWLALPPQDPERYTCLLNPASATKKQAPCNPPPGKTDLELLSKEKLDGLSARQLIDRCDDFKRLAAAVPRSTVLASVEGVIRRASLQGAWTLGLRRRLAESRFSQERPSPLIGFGYDDLQDQLARCTAAAYRKLEKKTFADSGEEKELRDWDARVYVAPWTFTEILATTVEVRPGDFEPGDASGRAVVYAARPVELAQSVSSVANAADAIQLAGALSAVAPVQGVGADLGIGGLQYAVGQAEAIERTPVIVGFADREVVPRKRGLPTTLARFGWVFGPHAYFDYAGKTATLRLQQSVVNQRVTADVSVPGWWPRVHLVLETAWVGNWHDVGAGQVDVLDPASGARVRREEFDIELPLNRADLDGLTTLLLRRFAGRSMRETHIDLVTPAQLSVCSGEATVLVYGQDVWRSSTSFLGPLAARSLRVLPDMEGVAVTFDLDGLPLPLGSDKQQLTISTRNGTDAYPFTIKGAATTKKCAS